MGAVFIGTENHEYSVSEGSSKCMRGSRWCCDIRLQTPGRTFVFKCEQEQDQREWLEAFRKVIAQPMTSEDYASKTLPDRQLFAHGLTATLLFMYFCSVADEASWRRGKWPLLPTGLQWFRMLDFPCWFYLTSPRVNSLWRHSLGRPQLLKIQYNAAHVSPLS